MKTKIAGKTYPIWIYQNFINFMRTFHHDEIFILNTFWSQDTHRYKNMVLYRRGNVITITNLKNGRIGVAKCHKKDRFDTVTGVAIAWARYCAKNEQQLTEINKTILQLDCNRLSEIPVNSYVCRIDSDREFFVVGTNPLDKDCVVCINCYSAQPINLPKNLRVRIV